MFDPTHAHFFGSCSLSFAAVVSLIIALLYVCESDCVALASSFRFLVAVLGFDSHVGHNFLFIFIARAAH